MAEAAFNMAGLDIINLKNKASFMEAPREKVSDLRI